MKHAQQRSSLFLLELIINLFLFVICAAVCVGILLYARGLSTESRDLTNAVYQAQTAAEMWRESGEIPVGCGMATDDLQKTLTEENGLLTVSVYKGDTLIYSLEGVSRDE